MATTKSGPRRVNDRAHGTGTEVQVQSKPNRFTGIDRNGAAITGASADSAAVVAERLFEKRVLSARITDADGYVVGGVGQVDGRRSWWGASEGDSHG